MKIVGITGGIASGKSTVAEMFRELGATVYSADADARVVLAEGSPALTAVFAAFPEARADDGTLDRAALAKSIFSDPYRRRRLEGITHPAIISRMRAVIDDARMSRQSGVLIYETPLLYECDLAPLFDAVIAVLSSRTVQRKRLQAREQAAGRPPLSAAELDARLAAQISSAEKARRADYVIHTDGALSATTTEVRHIWNTLQMGG